MTRLIRDWLQIVGLLAALLGLLAALIFGGISLSKELADHQAKKAAADVRREAVPTARSLATLSASYDRTYAASRGYVERLCGRPGLQRWQGLRDLRATHVRRTLKDAHRAVTDAGRTGTAEIPDAILAITADARFATTDEGPFAGLADGLIDYTRAQQRAIRVDAAKYIRTRACSSTPPRPPR